MTKLLTLLVVSVLLCTSCTPVEKVAYDTAVGAKAFLDSIKSKHPECATAMTTLCSDLRRATAAKDILIDAGEAYCNVAQYATTSTQPCMPAPKGTAASKQAIAAIQSAIAEYNNAAADLKAVVTP